MAFPQLLIVGLGNTPMPMTRHRYLFLFTKFMVFFFELILVPDRYSVGHLVVDSLASHFGIKLTNEFGGYFGQGNILIGETELSLNLFKSSP
jgi:peptidyl-tRNA hydrolase, PTH1 family